MSEFFNAKQISAQLRNIAIDQGLSQEVLAKKLKISRSHLNYVMHERREAGSKLLRALGYDATRYWRRLK